jgi:hypothetical protein
MELDFRWVVIVLNEHGGGTWILRESLDEVAPSGALALVHIIAHFIKASCGAKSWAKLLNLFQ